MGGTTASLAVNTEYTVSGISLPVSFDVSDLINTINANAQAIKDGIDALSGLPNFVKNAIAQSTVAAIIRLPPGSTSTGVITNLTDLSDAVITILRDTTLFANATDDQFGVSIGTVDSSLSTNQLKLELLILVPFSAK